MCWWTSRRTNSQRILKKNNAIGRIALAAVTWIGYSEKAKNNGRESGVRVRARHSFITHG
jgi:hypothetical protein